MVRSLNEEWFSGINYSLLSVLLISSKHSISDRKKFLEGIKFLDISNFDLEEVPEFIKDMTNLKVLKMNSNKLKTVTGEMLPASILKLELAGNNLSDFSFKEFSPRALTSIYSLDLSRNKLEKVPSKMYLATSLSRVYLSGNSISSITDKFPKSLLHLDMSNNMLVSVEESYTLLSKVTSLNISNNLLKNVPERMLRKNLSILNLEGNPLEEVGILRVAKQLNVEVIF
jgi:Leucine-rich repeat (LRR) protein